MLRQFSAAGTELRQSRFTMIRMKFWLNSSTMAGIHGYQRLICVKLGKHIFLPQILSWFGVLFWFFFWFGASLNFKNSNDLISNQLFLFRSDFMTLPFQATECYLAHVKPIAGKSFFIFQYPTCLKIICFFRRWLVFRSFSVIRTIVAGESAGSSRYWTRQ